MQKEEEVSLINVNEQTNRIEQQSTQSSTTYLWIKSIIVASMLTVIVLNTAYGITFPKDHPDCYKDVLFTGTAKINNWFQANEYIKNVLLIISSLSLDILALIFATLWTVKGNSWRPVFTLAAYYILRLICLVNIIIN